MRFVRFTKMILFNGKFILLILLSLQFFGISDILTHHTIGTQLETLPTTLWNPDSKFTLISRSNTNLTPENYKNLKKYLEYPQKRHLYDYTSLPSTNYNNKNLDDRSINPYLYTTVNPFNYHHYPHHFNSNKNWIPTNLIHHHHHNFGLWSIINVTLLSYLSVMILDFLNRFTDLSSLLYLNGPNTSTDYFYRMDENIENSLDRTKKIKN